MSGEKNKMTTQLHRQRAEALGVYTTTLSIPERDKERFTYMANAARAELFVDIVAEGVVVTPAVRALSHKKSPAVARSELVEALYSKRDEAFSSTIVELVVRHEQLSYELAEAELTGEGEVMLRARCVAMGYYIASVIEEFENGL